MSNISNIQMGGGKVMFADSLSLEAIETIKNITMRYCINTVREHMDQVMDAVYAYLDKNGGLPEEDEQAFDIDVHVSANLTKLVYSILKAIDNLYNRDLTSPELLELGGLCNGATQVARNIITWASTRVASIIGEGISDEKERVDIENDVLNSLTTYYKANF